MSLDITLMTDYCECCGRGDEVYGANITHNLVPMAKVLGIYACLWKAEESGIKTAGQLITPLGIAIGDMTANPPAFKAYDSPNGWGTYDNFLPWLQQLLKACEDNPQARVRVSV